MVSSSEGLVAIGLRTNPGGHFDRILEECEEELDTLGEPGYLVKRS